MYINVVIDHLVPAKPPCRYPIINKLRRHRPLLTTELQMKSSKVARN
jgi:hypothetical protein